MKKLAGFGGATIGGYVGWYLGNHWGMMTAFLLSTICSGVGTYYAVKWAREYEG